MTTGLEIGLRLVLWVALAPLVPGVVNRVKSWVAGRRGPSVWQLYYDLARLWRKGVVVSEVASPGFVVGPAVAWLAVLGGALLLPLGAVGQGHSFRGDAILLIYLLGLARFCTAWSALETGSAFEGMGAAREVSYGVLAEVAVITALLALSLRSGSVSLGRCWRHRRGLGESCWGRDCSLYCWRRTAGCLLTIRTRIWN
jgi:formate hydrogenlyase subunit 4